MFIVGDTGIYKNRRTNNPFKKWRTGEVVFAASSGIASLALWTNRPAIQDTEGGINWISKRTIQEIHNALWTLLARDYQTKKFFRIWFDKQDKQRGWILPCLAVAEIRNPSNALDFFFVSNLSKYPQKNFSSCWIQTIGLNFDF